MRQLVPTEYPIEQPEAVLARFRAEGVWQGEAIQTGKDGRKINVQASVNLVQDEGPLSVVAINRDITKQVHTEQALQESQRFINQIADTIPFQLYVFDLVEGKNIYINRQTETFFGLSLAELQARGQTHFLEVIHPDDMAKMDEFFTQWDLAEDGQIFEKEYRLRNAAGEYRWLRSSESVLARAADGAPAQIVGAVLDITEHKAAEESLRQSETRHRNLAKELKRLSARLMTAQETERRWLAQALHDELGQLLTAVSIDLEMSLLELPPEVPAHTRDRLAEAMTLTGQTLEQVRELSLDLHPSMLDDFGLEPTLEWYMERYSQRDELDIEFEAGGFEGKRLAPAIELALFRAVQEAMTNVSRHAHAGKVWVRLARRAGAVSLSVEDDGRGFDVRALAGHSINTHSLGLAGMKERVVTLGGTLQIQSQPGRGTRLEIEIPELPEQ